MGLLDLIVERSKKEGAKETAKPWTLLDAFAERSQPEQKKPQS